MATHLNPMGSLAMFTLPEKNDRSLPQFAIPDEYFFDTPLPIDSAIQDLLNCQQQQDPARFQFATALDPLLQDPKDVPSAYSAHASVNQSRPVSASSPQCSNEHILHGMPFSETWPHTMFADPKGNPAYLDTQSAFVAKPMPLSSYDSYHGDFSNPSVDPTLIQHGPPPFSSTQTPFNAPLQSLSQPPSLSPSRSEDSYQQWPPVVPSHSVTPALHLSPARRPSRNTSIHSLSSYTSQENGSGANNAGPSDIEGRERTSCPYPDCGKQFKDLKAHMLTHQTERPEKCPISNCDFHKRGFARKYDRNRHLITTHYKATVVCGFCPGEGSSLEMSFNRVDMFKRHLVAHHKVDQNNSAAKKRTVGGSLKPSPIPDSSSRGSSGRCTTCSKTFQNPQSLFDHIDDCILAVITQVDESESVNERNLRSVVDDEEVRMTLKRNSLPGYSGSSTSSSYADCDKGSDDVDDLDGRPNKAMRTNSGSSSLDYTEQEGRQAGHAGITYSKAGVDLSLAKGRRKRKHYPQSWGCSTDEMTLKKRVLCCFDGPRRLLKDDMMLGNEFHNRIQLPDGGYVTDLDVATLKRAEAFHNATEEEKGPWMATNYSNPLMPAPVGI